ncbi:MAG TPA: ADP-ribosylglycohydrolase family protein, partial [Nitriliruptorales bacterium]|nr:ADP-ribosylglycohydrolase family protein [Nitriliruptorales bacterium]
MDRRHDAATGALLGTFLGDALGAPWEGRQAAPGRAAPDRVRRSLAHAPLAYTDDTQLALALAAHLCEHPRVEPAALVATILEHFEPWRGYGGGMLGLVDQWRRGVPPEVAATAIFPEGSFG